MTSEVFLPCKLMIRLTSQHTSWKRCLGIKSLLYVYACCSPVLMFSDQNTVHLIANPIQNASTRQVMWMQLFHPCVHFFNLFYFFKGAVFKVHLHAT